MSADEREYGLGEGPAEKVSVSMRAGTIRVLREKVGKRSFSAYVDAAVERQIELDRIDEILMVNDAISGPTPPEMVGEVADLFRQVEAEHRNRRGAE